MICSHQYLHPMFPTIINEYKFLTLLKMATGCYSGLFCPPACRQYSQPFSRALYATVVFPHLGVTEQLRPQRCFDHVTPLDDPWGGRYRKQILNQWSQHGCRRCWCLQYR